MMLKKSIVTLTVAAALPLGLVACSGGGGAGDDSNYIRTNGVEPQNPLIPTNTNETGGGKIIDLINSGLVRYDTEGKPHNELADSIDLQGEKTYKVTLKDGIKFSDGTPIKAENFVKAWNYGMEHEHLSAFFFEPIKGYKEGAKGMDGLKVLNDKTFTIELNHPTADFPLRLGYSAFAPLPDSAFEDMEAFGQMPVSSGPYKLAEWNHNQDAILVPNENYQGERKAKNDGVRLTFYPKIDAAYADLLAGNLDVIDSIPTSAFSTYKNELGDRAISQPTATFQGFTIPERLPHFNGEEGQLRRAAISMAINRQQIIDKIFEGTRTPAKDFTSPVLDGYNGDIKGNEVTRYNPTKAKELWQKANAISPWSGSFELAYNADGDHQGWVDATTNSIKNTLGINAVGKPYPDFKSFRDEITNKTIQAAFRTGWQADYPGLGNFLTPTFATNGSSNDGQYSNPEFDARLKEAASASSIEESSKIYNEAQEILFKDLPVIPMWYGNVSAGSADTVDNVKFNWKSVPEFEQITRK